ncbi:MAG TPA: hemerythrin domain-containing protein [Burkholderiales bacterium]|nr:hemerythrin domain-containing protein [Burkholderiales bacterium]
MSQEVAIATIRQEHRTLGAVVSALQQWLASVAAGHAEPDFAFFSAALYYINDFPERYHHPKEEEQVFATLRKRTRCLDAAIDDLHAEHVQGAQGVSCLEHALVRYQGGAPDGPAEFKGAVDAYAVMLREHMRKEEELLTQAPAWLTGEDWRNIAAAFDANNDPLYGARGTTEFGKLYVRVLNMLPSKMREHRAGSHEHPPA